MDLTHLHLVLSHVPILGSAFGILLLLTGLIRSESVLIKAALITLTISALIAIPVFQTGESAEETVERIPGITEEVIEVHEEAAEQAIWLIGLLGTISLIGWIALVRKRKSAKTLVYLILILGAGVFIFSAYVGNLGGKIRHTEIRNSSNPGNQNISPEHENNDDS